LLYREVRLRKPRRLWIVKPIHNPVLSDTLSATGQKQNAHVTSPKVKLLRFLVAARAALRVYRQSCLVLCNHSPVELQQMFIERLAGIEVVPDAVTFVVEDRELQAVAQDGFQGLEHAMGTGGETTVLAAAGDVQFG
jgi:hypothetical protein